nr:hypothetical protein [Frondihabitans sp. 762G35]
MPWSSAPVGWAVMVPGSPCSGSISSVWPISNTDRIGNRAIFFSTSSPFSFSSVTFLVEYPKNADALLPLTNLTIKALPGAEPGDAGGVFSLAEDQQKVVDRVRVERLREVEKRGPPLGITQLLDLVCDRLVEGFCVRFLLLDRLGGLAGGGLLGAGGGGHVLFLSLSFLCLKARSVEKDGRVECNHGRGGEERSSA